MKKLLLLSLSFLCTTNLPAQLPTGPEVVAAAIQHHDPKGRWSELAFSANRQTSTEVDGQQVENSAAFRIDNRNGTFAGRAKYDDIPYLHVVTADTCFGVLENPIFAQGYDIREGLLGCESATRMYHFFSYMLGVPMKLNDPGTQIQEKVQRKEMDGKACYEVKVTYPPAIGEETWLFYFQESDYQLVAAQFYKDARTKDGELIFYRDYTKLRKVKLPQTLIWETMPDHTFLATDRYEFKK